MSEKTYAPLSVNLLKIENVDIYFCGATGFKTYWSLSVQLKLPLGISICL